jgi:hypothetical protein
MAPDDGGPDGDRDRLKGTGAWTKLSSSEPSSSRSRACLPWPGEDWTAHGVAEPISAAIGMAIILGLRGLGIGRAWSLPPIEKT